MMKNTVLLVLMTMMAVLLPQAEAAPMAQTPDSKTHKRPNILFILADDQSPFDLKIYNPDSILDTPVLDRLASEGMVLDGAYHMGSWSGAVCTPSRHMIMSGRTVWHIPGKHANARNPKLVPVDLPENTLAAIFNRAGYATMRTCNLKDNPHEYLREHHATQVVALTHSTPASGQVNLADDPKYADKLADMETLLLSEMRRFDDPYRLWNQPDDGLTPPVIQPRQKKKR